MSDYGKGDKRRPFDTKRWEKGWDRAFGKKGKEKRRRRVTKRRGQSAMSDEM